MEQLEIEQFKMESRQEFPKLLDLLARVIDANKGYSVNDISDGKRLLDAHYLANRFLGYVFTVLHLSHGTNVQDIPSFKFSFIDSASIDVLTRAVIEAFLVFHYVFFAPTTTEEKNYRYWAYKATGIAERQSLPEAAYEHKQTKAEDKKELNKLRCKLESNEVFQTLTEKQRARIFEGKERNIWRWNPDVKKVLSWNDIAINAGFSEMLASDMYRHLSGHAHSSYLSVLQTEQALINKETEQLIQGSIATMDILIANMISEYCALFPKVQDVLRESGSSDLIEVWIHIGHRLGENLDTGTK